MNTDSTKQRILYAAGPIFAENGYRGATVRDISESAGVNLASINYYFGDKKKLYVETVKTARQMRLSAFPSTQPHPTSSPELQLEEFIRLLLNRLVVVRDAPWEVKLLVREFMNPSDECRNLIEEFIRPVFRILISIVDSLVGGSLPDERLEKIGFSIIGQCLHYRCASEMITMFVDEESFGQHYGLEDLVQHITAFSLGAIEKIKLSAAIKPQTSA